MNTQGTVITNTEQQPVAAPWRAWLPVIIGLGVLYAPTFYDLFKGAWSTEKNAHGPIVLVVACLFTYFRVRQMLAQSLFKKLPEPVLGSLLLVLGLLCYQTAINCCSQQHHDDQQNIQCPASSGGIESICRLGARIFQSQTISTSVETTLIRSYYRIKKQSPKLIDWGITGHAKLMQDYQNSTKYISK